MLNNYEYIRLNETHLHDMSELLYQRQREETQYFPSLKHKHLNKDHIHKTLSNMFHQQKMIGIGAFLKSNMVGYVLASIEDTKSKELLAWVPYEGVAIQIDQPQELIRLLYTHVSEIWVKEECFQHTIYVPLGNKRYLNSFLHLSFYIEHVHAILDVSTYHLFDQKNDIHVRRTEKKDRETLGQMSHIVTSYHNRSPVYLSFTEDIIEQRKHAFERLVDENEVIVFIAEKEKQAIGYSIYEPIESNLMIPEDSIELSLSGVFPHVSGQGVGKALMNQGVSTVKALGYNHIMTDWKITNLSSSIFWPKIGFIPIVYKMIRKIDKAYVKHQ